jgi:transposase-like protein
MYSYEERLRAVKLYIKLGRRCKATIRELGYATKNSLMAWHNEFQERGDLKENTFVQRRSTRKNKRMWLWTIS